MRTYKINLVSRRDPNNPDNHYSNTVSRTIYFDGTITQARKEAYRLSREADTFEVGIRYDGSLIGFMVGVNAPGNENLWMVPDNSKPMGFRAQAIDASGRVREIWGH